MCILITYINEPISLGNEFSISSIDKLKMKVFVTGASGYVGTQVTQELLKEGYEILALARSDISQAALEKLDAKIKVLRGDLKDTEILKKGATESDGVIHLGFIHDFANYEECCRIDREAITSMCEAIKGTGKTFVYTSGTLMLPQGKLAVETDIVDPNFKIPRALNEELAISYSKEGVKSMCVRLSPTVHGDNDHGFIPQIMKIAKSKGFSAYIGDGHNSWSAVHKMDAAKLFLLALEKGSSGSRYHAAAELVTVKSIAENIGKSLNLPVQSIEPEQAMEHFGFFGRLLPLDNPISSEFTKKELGWEPTHATLFEDILGDYYSQL